MAHLSLLVHVDETSEARERLAAAVALAKRNAARLIGVGACGYPPPDPREPSHALLRAAAEDDLRQAEEVFRAGTEALPDIQWRRAMRRPAQALIDLACAADLVVASRTAHEAIPERFARADELVLSAGVPVLLHPPAAAALDARRIVVGWKDTREARRAIGDALPFLATADEVLVLEIAEADPPSESLDEVCARLRRHGANAKGQRRDRPRTSPAELLIDAAREIGGDLIVAGAYGHSRWREVALGGVTRRLLEICPHYLLLSH